MTAGPQGGAGGEAGGGAGDLTQDRLLGGRVCLSQPRLGYRAAIDPVLLAAAIDPRGGRQAVELGCGAGAATLCLAYRLPDVAVVGVERDIGLARIAAANVAANGFGRRVRILVADVAALPLPRAVCDQVMMNPPFLPSRRGTPSPDSRRRAAGVEQGPDLSSWVAAAAGLLRPRGWLTLIHRADRLDAICAALLPHFGSVAICPLWPRAGQPARRVVLRAQLGGRGPARLLAGLTLHDAGRGYTPEADAILRDGAPLSL